MPWKVPPICSVEGCGDPVNARGWCGRHYYRALRYGDPLAEPLRIVGDDARRIESKMDRTTSPEGCWLWTDKPDARGYGAISIGGTPKKAHRVVYERDVGPIPEGLDLDHLCHNEAAARGECEGGEDCRHRRCVNPAHLEPAPHRLNSQRGVTGKHNAIKTHCPANHPYEGDNLIIETSGSRRCRTCRDANMQRYMERHPR